MADTVMINYANMQRLSQFFQDKSQKTKAMHGRITSQKQILVGGAWIADAANKFYKEMDTILEGINRLSTGLNTASDVVGGRISNLFKQAEENGKSAIPNPQD